MSYTRTWDDSSPADVDKAGEGAKEIRFFKVDIKERLDDAVLGVKNISFGNLTGSALPTVLGGGWANIYGEYSPIDSLVTPTGASGLADGTIFIKLINTGGTITAVATKTAPVWNDTYLDWYGVSTYAEHLYVLAVTKASASYTNKRLIKHNDGEFDEVVIITSTTWTAPESKYYNIAMKGAGGDGAYGGAGDNSYNSTNRSGGGGGGGGEGATGYFKVYLPAGTVLTSVLSTTSGGNCTLTGTGVALTISNGTNGCIGGSYSGGGGAGGTGGVSSSGFDRVVYGSDGAYGVSGGYGLAYGGVGGQGGGQGGGNSTNAGNSVGAGGGGGFGGAVNTAGAGYPGGAGYQGEIRIK